MVHKKRSVLALLVLLGGASATTAQAPAGHSTPPASVSPGPMLQGAPAMYGGMPTGEHSALFNYYNGGMMGPEGGMGISPGTLPPDPLGPQRFEMPTPARTDMFAGGEGGNNKVADQKTIGIRLDSSYYFMREVEVGTFLSEYQSVGMASATFLPLQTPCWLLGVRAGGMFNGNNSISDDILGATTDMFYGTRFKHTYLKFGFFFDWTEKHRNYGFTQSTLTKLGILGNFTVDSVVAFGTGKDEFTTFEPLTGRYRRVEIADNDTQVRIGKFLSTYFQTGFTGTWTNFRRVDDEYSYGMFANWFIGGATLGADCSFGKGGAKGYFTLGYNWGGGRNIDNHPIDPYYDNPIDTVSWVSRPTLRDRTMRLRESPTGPGPQQINPVILE